VHRDHPVRRAVAIEKCEVDGNHQGLPLEVRDLEIGEQPDATRNAKIVCASLSAKQHNASITRANNLPLLWVQQMLVRGEQLSAAQLALLDRRTPARELTQERRCRVALRVIFRWFSHCDPSARRRFMRVA